MEVLNHSLWLMFSYQSVGFSLHAIPSFSKEKRYATAFGFFMLNLGLTGFLLIYICTRIMPPFLSFSRWFFLSLTLTPLFYLHHKSLLVKDFQLKSIDLKHFVPAFVMLYLNYSFLGFDNNKSRGVSGFGLWLVFTSKYSADKPC